ncbi:MAG: type II toxin-antitoxin system VapC family toxin [Acidobacteriaceae bacterium]
MILADTSVWIDHLRRSDPVMTKLLLSGKIAMHPCVAAELALGSLHNRRRKLALMDALWRVNVADFDEVRRLIESHSLYSRGIGLTDVHLLASCMMTVGVQLWTRDKPLAAIAKPLGLYANPA